MSLQDDDVKVLDSSTSEPMDLDDIAPAKADDGDKAASSSAKDEDSDSLLSVVRDVVDGKTGQKDQASSAKGAEAEPATAEPVKKEPAEDYSDVPFHKHPRFQELLRKSKSFEQDATRYRAVQDFLDTGGLLAEEAADGLQIMALAKTQPAEAWKRVRPWVEKILHAAGEVLPSELQAAVDSGQITREHAFALNRSQAQVQSFEAQRSFEEQRRARQAEADRVQSVQNAAAQWEQDRLAKDPNFAAKNDLLVREISFLQRSEGVPNTAEGVTAQLNKAYAAVNKAYVPPAQAAPVRKAVRPVTGGQSSGNAAPEPKSMLDIVRQARG